MSLYKRGKVWIYDFWVNGERYNKSTGMRNRRDADLVESALKVELSKAAAGIQPQRQRGPVPKFDQAMAEFLDWSAIEHADKPETTRRYKISSLALLSYFGQTKLNRIDTEAVEAFKEWRRVQKAQPKKTKGKNKAKATKQIMPATVNRELACLKSLFYFFIKKRRLLTENPVSDVKMLKEVRRFHILTPEAERKYLAECTQPLRDIAVMMVETGMRPEEIYGMRLSDVHLKEAFYFNSEGKTPSAQRRIPLTSRACEIIADRLTYLDSEFLFPGEVAGKPIVKANAAHYGALRRSKLPKFRLYDLRHTFATRFVEAGGDLVTLAQILGHKDLRMVMVYSHPTDPHKLKSMQQFEQYSRGREKELNKVPTVFPTAEDLGDD